MFFFDLLEIVLSLLTAAFLLFQIIIPIWHGTVLFPTFRSKTRMLEKQLRQARLEVDLAQERKKLKQLEEELKGNELP